jgi:transposase
MDRRPTPYDHLSRDQLIDLVVEQAARIEQLEARNRALEAQNGALTARVAEQADRITALESQVRQLLEKLGNPPTPKNSSLPPSQGKKPNRPDAKGKARPRRPGFFERALHPNPDAIVKRQVGSCPGCGSAELRPVGTKSYDHHELVAAPIRTTRVELEVCACGRCGRRAVAAPPPGLEPGQLLGERLTGFLLVLRHYLDAPYRRIRLLLDELFGIRLSNGHLVAVMAEAAAGMAPAVAAIEAAIRSAPVVLSDETGLRVGGRNGFVWMFRTAFDIRFLVDRTRSKKVVAALLADARPECWISDRYGGQQGWAAEHQTCLAHLRRACVRAVERGDTAFAAALEQTVLDILAWDGRKPEWADATLAARWQDMERRLDRIVAIAPLHPEGETLRRWVKAHRAELTLCLRRRDVPATNNASERALRPIVTARKVFGCCRSWEGARVMADIRTVLMTARARGLRVMDAIGVALAGDVLPPGADPVPVG